MFERTDQILLGLLTAQGMQALTAVSLSRSDLSARKMAMFRNDYQTYVDEVLMSNFSPENFRDLRLYTHTATNILERVVREVCRLYQEPPTRYLSGSGDPNGERISATGRVYSLLGLDDVTLLESDVSQGGVPAAAPQQNGGASQPAPAVAVAAGTPPQEIESPFDRYLAAADLDCLLGDAEKLAEFHPAAWIMPVVRSKNGENVLDFDLYTPAVADVIPDPKDPTEAMAWYTWRFESIDKPTLPPNKEPQKRRVYYVWTATTFKKYDDSWKPMANDLQPDEVNPLGRLPVTVVRCGRPLDGYFCDGVGDDLYDATLEVAILRTLQTRAFRDSSFKQLAIDADSDKVPAGQLLGNPAFPIYLGENATAQVLDFAPDLGRLSAVVTERIQDIATKYGISPASWSMTEKAQSGFSKRMDQAAIVKNNRAKRKWFAAAEKDLYRLCAKVLAAWPVQSIGSLDEKADYVVDFADPRFEEAPLEQARADALRLELGITNILEIYLRENPDLTEAEAVQQLALNQAINKRFLDEKQMTLLDILAEGGHSKGGGGGGGGGQSPGGPNG